MYYLPWEVFIHIHKYIDCIFQRIGLHMGSEMLTLSETGVFPTVCLPRYPCRVPRLAPSSPWYSSMLIIPLPAYSKSSPDLTPSLELFWNPASTPTVGSAGLLLSRLKVGGLWLQSCLLAASRSASLMAFCRWRVMKRTTSRGVFQATLPSLASLMRR